MKNKRLELVPASPAHVGRLAVSMRDIDRLECSARGRTPKQALRLALRASSWAVTAMLDGYPSAMFGISPVSAVADKGCPWFLGTDAVMQRGRDLLLVGPEVIAHMHEHSALLQNSVSSGNTKAIRLLRRWGFTIGDEAFKVGGIEFVRFWRDKENV